MEVIQSLARSGSLMLNSFCPAYRNSDYDELVL